MRAKRWSLFLLIPTVLILIFYNSCGRNYTFKGSNISVMGNPMTSTRILRATCQVINRCHPEVSLTTCQEGVMATAGIENKLGLPAGAYNNYASMTQAEQSGFFATNDSAMETCLDQINQLTCGDAKVQGAYDSTAVQPFAGVANMIPSAQDSCSMTFKTGVKAFPTAEGFGAETVGGRGGRIIHVTNLNDSGPGSLRAALTATGPRIVVFDVSGTINISSRLEITNPASSFLTVAGQTSPGGIQIKGPLGLMIYSGVHDVVIRHLRIRPGEPTTATNEGGTIFLYAPTEPVSNIIVDHCSFEWGVAASGMTGNGEKISFQWSIFANDLGAPAGSGVGIGSEPQMPVAPTVSFHHNVIAHSRTYAPVITYMGVADFRNNLVYNSLLPRWGAFEGNRSAFGNNVNNHYLFGTSNANWRGFWVANGGPTRVDGSQASFGGTKLYTDGNWSPTCPGGCADDWDNGFFMRDYEEAGIDSSTSYPASASQFRVTTPFPVPPVTTDSAGNLKNILLASVGADKPSRDSVDTTILDYILNSTDGYSNSPGPWANLTGGLAPVDTDDDGMPDTWEWAHGLNANDGGDGALEALNGYTNVENYLNELAGDPIP